MAVITPTVNSQQMANIAGQPLTYLRPNELGGRMRVAFFYFAPTADPTSSGILSLTKLPAGARIIGGQLVSLNSISGTTMSVGLAAADGSGVPDANTSDYDPGNGQAVLTADNATYFATTLGIGTDGTYTFAGTAAQHYGYVFQKECFLIGSFGTHGMTANSSLLYGHVTYIVD